MGEELAARQGPAPNPSHPPLCGAKRLGFQGMVEEAGAGIPGDCCSSVFRPLPLPSSLVGEAAQRRSAWPRLPQETERGVFFHAGPPPSWCVLGPHSGVSPQRPGPERASGHSGSNLPFPSCLSQARKGCQVRGLGRGGRILGWVPPLTPPTTPHPSLHSGHQGRLPSSSLSKVKQPPGQPAPKPVYHRSPRERFRAQADKQTEALVPASRPPFRAPGCKALRRPSTVCSLLIRALGTSPHPANCPVPV